ncbi:MAG: glycosyltransferase [Acidimicrobiales bacterium]
MSAADGVRLYTAAELDPTSSPPARATSVSVCLPARNEAATLGPIIDVIIGELMAAGPGGQPALVDELLVLDDGSTDATAAVAAAHGARVVSVDTVLPELGAGRGKGNVLWRSLAGGRRRADRLVRRGCHLLPGRLRDRPAGAAARGPRHRLREGLLRPADRSQRARRRARHRAGGPTAAVALLPRLASLRQPLAGEMAGRRAVLEAVPFVQGYGVETGLLIDITNRFGFDSVVQVDLGVRRHRHQPLDALAVQATEILQVVLDRAGLPAESMAVELARSDGSTVTVPLVEWPPMDTVAARGVSV